MLTEKEKVKLDEDITKTPDEKEEQIKNGWRDTEITTKVSSYQDDAESPVFNTDSIWYLKIEKELEIKEFYLLFENVHETLDSYEEEIKRVILVRYKNGKDFKKEMEERYGE